MYLPEATFTGKSLYYSYETCGSEDHFTKEWNTEACVNQKSKDDCLELKVRGGGRKCGWTCVVPRLCLGVRVGELLQSNVSWVVSGVCRGPLLELASLAAVV